MKNERLLAQAEELLTNYYNAEKISFSKEKLKSNIYNWYQNTEITNAYDLATISIVTYSENIPYTEIKEYIESNRSKITCNNIIPVVHKDSKEDKYIAGLWWFFVLNVMLQCVIFFMLIVFGYSVIGYAISLYAQIDLYIAISAIFLFHWGHGIFLVFLRDKYKQSINKIKEQKNEK